MFQWKADFFFFKGVEKEKACKIVPAKTKVTRGDCQSVQQVELPYCEGSCNTYTK